MTLLRQYRRSRESMLVCVADSGRLAPPGWYDRNRDGKRHSYWLFASGTLVRSLIAISAVLSRSLARVGVKSLRGQSLPRWGRESRLSVAGSPLGVYRLSAQVGRRSLGARRWADCWDM